MNGIQNRVFLPAVPDVEPIIPPTPPQSSALAFRLLILFTVILFLAPQAQFPVLAPFRIAFWTAALACAAYVLDRILHRRRLTVVTREIVLAVSIVGWAVLTVPLSMWPGGSIETLQDQYLKSLTIFWLLANVVTSTRRFRQAAWVLSLMSIPLSLTGINNYVTGTFLEHGDVPLHRIRGYEAALTANPNDLALMLNLLLPLSVALLFTERQTHRRLLLVISIAFSVVAVILTFSRGGFVTLAGIGLLYLWHFRGRPERRWVFAALLLVLVLLPLLPGAYVERIATITDPAADPTGSAEARRRDMGAAVSLVLKHPLVGAGIGNDQLALNEERGPYWTAIHNVYLQYAVDLGIPGLVFFLLILIGCLRRLRTMCDRPASQHANTPVYHFAQGLRIALSAFALAALFHPVAYHFYFYYVAGLAVGLTQAPATRL